MLNQSGLMQLSHSSRAVHRLSSSYRLPLGRVYHRQDARQHWLGQLGTRWCFGAEFNSGTTRSECSDECCDVLEVERSEWLGKVGYATGAGQFAGVDEDGDIHGLKRSNAVI